MTSPALMLMGAQQRLLPFWLIYRFFLAAAVFHVAAWVGLAVAADEVPFYRGGTGPVLGALHALTLGCLVMVALGAMMQILPVATGRAPRALWPARAASWSYIPGVAVLLFGFFTASDPAMAAGGALVAVGLALAVGQAADILNRTRDMLGILRAYTWAALAALVTAAALGLAAIINLRYGFLPDHGAVALAHFFLAAFGFMTLLGLGFSQILVPMFALTEAPARGPALTVLGLAGAGLATAVAGALTAQPIPLVMAAVLGLFAAGLYVREMRAVLKRGMRKNLGLSFVMVKAAWGLLLLCLVVGGAAALGLERAMPLFVFLTLFGWLLTFVLGLLQRIIPFLAAMNASKGAMPRLSDLADERVLKAHAGCHFAAVTILAAGIAAGVPLVVLAGALIGVAGALIYLWFALGVPRRLVLSQSQQRRK